MKKSSILFYKTYTRNTALILQQLWPTALEEGIKKLGIVNKYSPAIVDFTVNGICEIWERDQAVRDIKKQFVSVCRKEPRKALLFLKWFQAGVRSLEPIWQKDSLNSLVELKKFVSQVKKYMPGDMFITYVGVDRRIQGSIKKLAAKLRAQDHYFVSTNQVIINSLRKIFPQLKNYVEVLKIEDLDYPPTVFEMRRRWQKYICTSDGYSKIETLQEYARRHHYIFEEEKPNRIKNGLRGSAANLGQAQGRVKLVFSQRDLSKVKLGDIIVSPMTTADMMPAIRKAAAIVTDEGGLLCHAAIVSRELNKPCLLATKAATKILKDNDLVEVDVYKKIVKKL